MGPVVWCGVGAAAEAEEKKREDESNKGFDSDEEGEEKLITREYSVSNTEQTHTKGVGGEREGKRNSQKQEKSSIYIHVCTRCGRPRRLFVARERRGGEAGGGPKPR